jgi:hypothetical protein
MDENGIYEERASTPILDFIFDKKVVKKILESKIRDRLQKLSSLRHE